MQFRGWDLNLIVDKRKSRGGACIQAVADPGFEPRVWEGQNSVFPRGTETANFHIHSETYVSVLGTQICSNISVENHAMLPRQINNNFESNIHPKSLTLSGKEALTRSQLARVSAAGLLGSA